MKLEAFGSVCLPILLPRYKGAGGKWTRVCQKPLDAKQLLRMEKVRVVSGKQLGR